MFGTILFVLQDEPERIIGVLSAVLGGLGCLVFGRRLMLLRRINRGWKSIQETNEPAVIESQAWLIGYLQDQKAHCKSPDELASLEAWLKREEVWLSEHKCEKSQAARKRLLWSRSGARASLQYLCVNLGLLIIGVVVCILTCRR